jgi:hypothetical protein
MELLLRRGPSTELSTIGLLCVDDEPYCFTLEDPVRDKKIAGVTAIPAGRYQIAIAMSPKRKKLVPWILRVPNYDAIQIHAGNEATDTSGCILVGFLRGTDRIYRSREALAALMNQLNRGMTGGDVWITIEDWHTP